MENNPMNTVFKKANCPICHKPHGKDEPHK